MKRRLPVFILKAIVVLTAGGTFLTAYAYSWVLVLWLASS
jgi:hypothetical protein